MDENNKNPKGTEAKNNSEKSESRNMTSSIKVFFTDLIGEFKKIIWPSRKDLTKETITVIATTLLVGAIISGMDYIFALGYNFLIGLAG